MLTRRLTQASASDTASKPPSTPGQRYQEHHRDPFQPETANDMLVRGADRIPVIVRVLGASTALKSKTCAWTQTRCEKSGAKGVKTSKMASGRGGIGCPPSIACTFAEIIYPKGHLTPLPIHKGQSGIRQIRQT